MAALYLAYWLELDAPYWAMASAYIVSHPFAGPMRSKSLYRIVGTLIGDAAAVVLVPNLVDAPLLLALIRVEEICLGIIFTTMIGTVVFPRAIGPVLARRIVAWMKPAIDWATAALAGREEEANIGPARQQLAAEPADVAMMTTQLAYDTSHLQAAAPYLAQLRVCVLSLVPVLSAINDRVTELHRLDGITPRLKEVLDAVSGWIQRGEPESSVAIRTQIGGLERNDASWTGLLRAGLVLRWKSWSA